MPYDRSWAAFQEAPDPQSLPSPLSGNHQTPSPRTKAPRLTALQCIRQAAHHCLHMWAYHLSVRCYPPQMSLLYRSPYLLQIFLSYLYCPPQMQMAHNPAKYRSAVFLILSPAPVCHPSDSVLEVYLLSPRHLPPQALHL